MPINPSENPDVKRFLKHPSEETFAKVTQLGSALIQILENKPELAKKYFKFVDWLTLENNCLLTIDAGTKQLIKGQLKASISSFDDAYKYYYTLCTTAQEVYAPQLIGFATNAKHIERLNSTLGEPYKGAIEKRKADISMCA